MALPRPGRRVDSPALRARFLAGLRASMTLNGAAAAGIGRGMVYKTAAFDGINRSG
jgi:hypothetical protein